MPWRRSLTLVPLMPATTVNELSAGLVVMTGNLSARDADDHVDVVARFDRRTDAGDLVDLDRDGSLGRRHVDVADRARGRFAEGLAR